jgi:hypothetical protein
MMDGWCQVGQSTDEEVLLSRLFGVLCSEVSEKELMMKGMFNGRGRWSYLYTDGSRSTRDPDGGHANAMRLYALIVGPYRRHFAVLLSLGN